MDPFEIGLFVTGGMVLAVFLGMRVAFAAALAGLIGIFWIFWAKFGYDPARFGKAMTVAVKAAGQVPHGKIQSQALSLIPTFILIGYLAYHAGFTRALFEAAKRLSYPILSISGIAMRAKTAAVATLAPDTAAKPAVANTVDTAKPPGTHAIQRFAASNRARVKPA